MTYAASIVHELIQHIYLAAAEPDRWPKFLELLRRRIDAGNTQFTFTDTKRGGMALEATAGLDPEAVQLYHARFAAIDPFSQGTAALGPLRPGFIGLVQDLISDEELARTEFYQQFGERYGCIGGLICVVCADGPVVAVVGACRKPGRFFGPPEVKLFSELLPHLRTAMQIHRELLRKVQIGRAALATLNRLPCAAFICDATGEVLHTNRAAHNLAPSVTIGEPLRFASAGETEQLRRAIVRAGDFASRGEGGDILVPLRASFGNPALAVVAPVHQKDVMRLILPMIAVIINAPPQFQGVEIEGVAAVYGLTTSESRLASSLLQGRSLTEAARRSAISYETARTYLKRIFEKTNTSRQTELIRTLLTTIMPPAS